MGLVIISYGCKVPAGIFVPSMAIGATFGRMLGIMVKAMQKSDRRFVFPSNTDLPQTGHFGNQAFLQFVLQMYLASHPEHTHS